MFELKKIISVIFIILLVFMVACSKSNSEVNGEYNKNYKGLFVTNYHSSDGSDGEVLYLNDRLELLDKYIIKGTDQIAEENLDGQIITYGIYGINNINLKSGNVSNSIEDGTIINIYDNRWAVDGGYLKGKTEYVSRIKDLKKQ